jgi:hypothetical protein
MSLHLPFDIMFNLRCYTFSCARTFGCMYWLMKPIRQCFKKLKKTQLKAYLLFQVLAQQRAEQSRLAAEQGRGDNPELPVDPAGFISSLPASLRQQVLADMDDTMVAVLPPELAAEAQTLRRELEDRHRRLMQERLFAQGAASLSAILRHTGRPSP